MTSANVRAGVSWAKRLFSRIHQFGAASVHDTSQIGQPDILAWQAQIQQQVHAGERRRPCAAHHHFDARYRLAHHLQPIDTGCGNDNGGAVLIVVKHRDLHAAPQFALNDEAFRRLDVLQVDRPESGFQRGNHFNQFLRITLFNLDVEDVYSRKFLK